MPNFFVFLIGICILLIFILNSVGVFTPSWIIPSIEITFGVLKSFDSIGIVPYRPNITNELPWFGVASILIYISTGLFILIIFIYIFICFKINENGYDGSLRKWVNIIGAFSLLIFSFTFISVLLIGADLQLMNNQYNPVEFSLGYSVWLCIGSSVLLILVIGPSFYLSYERIKEHSFPCL